MQLSRVLHVQHVTSHDWFTLMFVKQYKLWNRFKFLRGCDNCPLHTWALHLTFRCVEFYLMHLRCFGRWVFSVPHIWWLYTYSFVGTVETQWTLFSLSLFLRMHPQWKGPSRQPIKCVHLSATRYTKVAVYYVRNITIEWLRFLLWQPWTFLLPCRSWA
jgi:hypothetical protein